MFSFLFNSPAWQLIVQSDWMTKLVLLGLFLTSVVCIAIVIFKYLQIRKEKKQLLKLLYETKKVKSFGDLINVGKKFQDTVGGNFLEQNLQDLRIIIDENDKQKITLQDFEYLEIAADQSIERILSLSESYLPTLSTSAAVSPLVGLFGTVWGLIHSFVNISREKSADISVVAPGIAEALTTTLAGLIVAIPALIAFNYFSNELRKQEQQLNHLSDKYLNMIKRAFLEK